MNRKTLVTLGVLAVFILSACTPTVSAPTPLSDGGMDAAATPAEEAAPAQEDASAESPVAATEAPAEPEPTAEVMAMPTSRGSQLVATDPASVNLTSGGPQLIEFFAFW